MEENGGQVETFGEQAAAAEPGWAAGGEWGQAEEEQQQQVWKTNKFLIFLILQDWSGADWSNQQSNGEVASWSREASVEQPAPPADPAAPAPVIDPNADIWKAVVLFTFQANNEDEINITENEQVDIMVKECDEEGWVMVRNSSGQKGYAPTNYLEVFASESLGVPASSQQPMQTIPENSEPPPVTGGWAGQNWGGGNEQQATGGWEAEKRLVTIKIAGGWATGRGAETETEGESETEAETEDEGPPPGWTISGSHCHLLSGMALPPPPPPQISVEGAEGVKRPVSIQVFNPSKERLDLPKWMNFRPPSDFFWKCIHFGESKRP